MSASESSSRSNVQDVSRVRTCSSELCLCGNFNSIQKDDLRSSSGTLETNIVDFANSWKVDFKCKNIKIVHEHPCVFGMDKEKYAHYWCNVLLEIDGPFAPCHSSVSPSVYQQNCLFDTCSCKRAEDCLCASISSYVWACADAGVILYRWREHICMNFKHHCPPSFVYSYTVTTCIPTCRSLSEPDPACNVKFHTVDGCVCPNGTYLNDKGVCVKLEDCPCYYKGIPVSPNEHLSVGRFICTCINRTWVCDDNTEKGICTAYGEGHYITFDNKRYTINGDCEYILVQDYCDFNHLWNGTFKVISENIPCGTTGSSCSMTITIYLGSHKLILTSGGVEVSDRPSDVEIPYKIRDMGLYLIVETKIGIIIVWDQKTSIYIHLSKKFKGKVCGLCGNFDGNGNNDFTTRSQCVVQDVKQFRDSWKISPYCPEVYISKDPCVVHPYRIPWAQRMCNIILSSVFAPCHSEIDPEPYYEACVRDTCACDMGGDCDCYCTAVSAYAQACSEVCVCAEWRSSTVCRCYPKCPEDKPYFNEDEMQCVSQCGCLLNEDQYYMLGEQIESCNVCEICICTENGINCHKDDQACNCDYNGHMMELGEAFEVANGYGCIKLTCGSNGLIETPCDETTETITSNLN
ncbi:mucin-2-like [Anomaloglossus baeobatrachus]